ncbi:unnamed protein product [Brassica rapa subsp. trilocularis]
MAAASNGSEYFDIDVETGRKSFARSLNAETVEQDEEDLRWAAMGRLPSQRQGSHLATLHRSQTSVVILLDLLQVLPSLRINPLLEDIMADEMPAVPR